MPPGERVRVREPVRYSASVAVALAVAFAGPAAARAARADSPADESVESARLYQAGMDSYTRGDLDAAQASFREALRLEPSSRSALAAVRRLESELSSRPAVARRLAPAPARRPESAGGLDRFFLVSLPRWFYFERTLGDGLRDVGTLAALNARVVQLMGEREIALARNRPFRKDRLLRALLRRTSVATQRYEEA